MCVSQSMMVILFAISFAISWAAPRSESPFPPYITPCPRDSNAWQCVMDNIERCRPHLAKGIPKLGVPSLSPFVVPRMELQSKEFGVVLQGLKVWNLDKMTIKGGNIDFKNYTLNVHVEIPFFYNEFKYEASGAILMINFKGEGYGYVNASNVSIKANLTGRPITVDGVEYINFHKYDLDYRTGNGSVSFPKLFGPREDLTVRTNKLINENYKEFEEELRPYIAKSVAELMREIAKNFFLKVPYNILFPIVK